VAAGRGGGELMTLEMAGALKFNKISDSTMIRDIDMLTQK